MKIILGSKSPRRRELMSLLGFEFTIDYPRNEESVPRYKNASDYVRQTSLQKALEIRLRNPEAVVIGADTIVLVQNEILGKPKNIEDARKMLSKLINSYHMVLTGVTILAKKKQIVFIEKTKVFIDEVAEEDLETYISTCEPYDKAGGYAIQGSFAKYIKRIEGDYYNVVGLPINRLYKELKKIKNEW